MTTKPTCPHCTMPMDRWATPEGSSWDARYLWVCFNDECPYFARGWEFLERNYGRRASYRHCLNPTTGAAGPLPVWSHDALRNQILDDEGGEHDGDE